MPRGARVVPETGYLHVMCRGNNRRKIFFKPQNYRFYHQLAVKYKKLTGIKIIHYCFMPNHVHFMIGVKPASDLATFMKRLNLSFFYYYRRNREYVGHLWQGRFKSKIIEKDDYFLCCGKYIELNPVRAGLCDSPQDYPYSSYAFYALGKPDYLLDMDPFYPGLADTLKGRQKAYCNIIIPEDYPGK